MKKDDSAPFTLHRRGQIYYVQFRSPDTQKWTSAKSTGAKDRNSAFAIVAAWMRDGVPQDTTPTRYRPLAEIFSAEGILDAVQKVTLTPEEAARIIEILKKRGLVSIQIPQGPGGESFVTFLRRFWNFDESEYIRDKLTHGHSYGRRRCYDMNNRLEKHVVPSFEGRRLDEVALADLRRLSTTIARKGLASASNNRILDVVTIPLTWAHENAMIPTNPSDGLVRFSGARPQRGTFTPEEVISLFSEPWDDEESYIGNLVAATCGLRAGEILALHVEDIGLDRLYVRHAWATQDGLKTPKSNESREAPLLAEVRQRLLDLAARNPHGPKGFIFHSARPGTPMAIARLLNPLRKAFIRLKAGTEEAPEGTEEGREAARSEWDSRGLCFHSWRHYYASRMADLVDARKVMTSTGHKTQAVFNAYADHALASDFAEVGQATRQAFGKILKMPERKGQVG